MQSLRKLRISALACAAAFLACELISRPWAEMGVSDDWSYIRSAQTLAQTGHVVYVGWASAIVGWQLYLGAVLIKIFGFSFTAPRIGTLLVALLTAFLMQRTLVHLGLKNNYATLGTLTFVLSPLFMMLSATMMSDVPGFFSILACLYGCVRALQSPRDRNAILWLIFAVAVNAICGTSRQIVWLGVLVLVPSTLFLLRARRLVLVSGLLTTALGFAFVFIALHWFNTQPYALPEPLTFPPLQLQVIRPVLMEYVKSVRAIALLLLPLSLPYIAEVRRFSRRNLTQLAVLICITAAALYLLGHGTTRWLSWLSPFLGDWVSARANFDALLLTTKPPRVVPYAIMALLSLLTFFSLFCIAEVVVFVRPAPRVPANAISWRQYAVLFGPLTFVYLFLLSRHAESGIFDRYLFTPLFIALVCLLRYSQERLGDHFKGRLPAATLFAVGVLAFYGVVSTHNLFALDRARIALANEALAQGSTPSQLDMGWEWNGWYELQLSPTVNEPHIVTPHGTFRIFPPSPAMPGGCEVQSPYGFYPHLAPRYGISFDPNTCDGLAPFAPVSYSTWPLRTPTTIYLVNYPPPWKSVLERVTPGTAPLPVPR